MFGNSSLPSVIYRYGANEPILNLPLVIEHLRAAHRYRNKLVEIERLRRDAAASVVSSVSPELASLEAEYVSLDLKADAEAARIKLVNKTERKQRATIEDRQSLAAIRSQKREVYARLKEAKKLAYSSPDAKARLAEVDAIAIAEGKAARAVCGCGWGSYLAIEQSLTGIRQGPPPKFLPWLGNGKLAVQLQGGMSLEEAELGDNRLRIETVVRGKQQNVWMRIGSDENRNPLWAVVPVVLHRPLPRDAQIKWVYLTARRVACHTQWGICFVLARAEGWKKDDLSASGKVAVDLGWRLVNDGLRVAYWRGSDGQEGEVVISHADVSRWTKADDLRSIRDDRFNVARDALADWMENKELLPWLAEKTEHLRQWRSAARLAGVVVAWRDSRFDGDAEIFTTMEAWRKKDKHLYEWQENQRRKSIAWREHLYRNLAADLSRRYKSVVVEDANWREIGAKPDVGEAAENPIAARNRVIASPGLLRRFLRERFAEYVEVKSANTTQICGVCGKVMGVDAAATLSLVCPHCQNQEDQDRNAAGNMLVAIGAVA